MAVPRLAPSTRAKAASSGIVPLAAKDITNRTTATLEWAAQVSAAARITSSIGWVDTALRNVRRPAIFSYGSEQIDELVQSHQHQTKSDQHAAEVTRASRRAAEHQHPDQDQRRRNLGDVERQHLHDERGADIGAEHDGKSRHQVDEAAGRKAGDHKARCRATLQQGGHTDPGKEGLEAVAERAAQEAPICPKSPLHAGLDHWTPHRRSATDPARSTG